MNNKEAELVLQMTQDLTFGSPSKETIRRLSPIIPNLIRAGLGIGFVPAITWGTAMESFLTLLRLTDTKLERTLRLSWQEDRYPSRAEQAVVAGLRA